MDKIEIENKFLEIFNRNVPLDDRYTINEIKIAFSKEAYSSGNDREKFLYNRFFTECVNNEYLEWLCNSCNTTTRKIKKLYKSLSNEKKIEFSTFWSSKFRLPKVLGKILSRNHEKYTNIDNFGIYELTPCIAYEMAIRNKEVKKLLKRHNKISKRLYEGKYNVFLSKNLCQCRYRFKDEKELEQKYSEYKTLFNRKQNTYNMLIKKDYKSFIDDNIDMCTELTISTLHELEKNIEDELINNYLIYPKGYRREIPGAKSIYQEEITNSKKKKNREVLDPINNKDEYNDGYKIAYEKITYDEFIQFQGIYINTGEYYVNNIIPNFNRQVNDQNQINIPINFSLPLEEIIEYITLVKKKINPKTPLELLGEKLDKANDMSNIKVGKETLDATRGEEPQKKFADMFFIYDMRQQGFTNDDIEMELNYSNDDKGTKISTNTINKYYKIAKIYIEKERYKELITGKSFKK